MLKYFLLILMVYFFTRFIIGFVIPVAKAALTMRRKMREMSDLHGQQRPDNSTINTQGQKKATASVQRDYIDFEEIKD